MADKELLILKGKTFSLVVRWETEPIIYKAITGISLDFGAPRLTVPGHGLPDGWRGAITRVKGMTQVNAQNSPPRSGDYLPLRVIDANTVELNGVDATGFSDYLSGGFLQFYTPQPLAAYAARFAVKDKIGGTVLASNNAEDGEANVVTATVSDALKTITLRIPAPATAAIAWKRGVAELEMYNTSDATDVVRLKLVQGAYDEPDPVRVVGEVPT